jgi:hypothetical protein
VRNLNDLRNAAINQHEQMVISIMQETFLESARPLNEYVTIEHFLAQNFEFFLTSNGDAHDELAKPLLDQLDGPVKSMKRENSNVPYVSALWLVNRLFQRKMLGLVSPPREDLIPRYLGAQYLDAFSALYHEARRIREILQRVLK